jgi:hypothetical protein
MSRHNARNGPGGDAIREFEAQGLPPKPLGANAPWDPYASERCRLKPYLAQTRRAQEWAWVISTLVVILIALAAIFSMDVGREKRDRHIKMRHEQATPLDNATQRDADLILVLPR